VRGHHGHFMFAAPWPNEANMVQIRFDLCPGVDVYGKDKMCSDFPFLKNSRILDYRIIIMIIR